MLLDPGDRVALRLTDGGMQAEVLATDEIAILVKLANGHRVVVPWSAIITAQLMPSGRPAAK